MYDAPMRASDNIIQSLWVGSRLNALAQLSLASFLAHGHPVHLYTYGPVKGVPKGVTVMDANTIMPYDPNITVKEGFGKGSVGPFANWFRYQLLVDRGGIWTDTDVVCLTPWISLPKRYIASERVNSTSPGQPDTHATCCVLRFPPGDPFMVYCLEQAQQQGGDNLSWGLTGPRLIERALAKFPEYRDAVFVPDIICSLNPWDVAHLIKPNSPWQPSKNAIGVHCWQECWRHSMSDLKTRPLLEQWHYWLHPTQTLHVNRRYPTTTHVGQWQAQYADLARA